VNNVGQSETDLTITNTTVQGNAGEGIFILTNAGGNTTTPFTTVGTNVGFGGVGITNNVVLSMNADQVLGNGSPTVGSGGLVIVVGTSQFGSVQADIENSTFLGNTAVSSVPSNTGTGSDVLFTGYTSAPVLSYTAPPSGSVIPDPLSRFDLQFRGNTVGVLDASHFVFNGTQNILNVFYNNSDAFKSPTPTFTSNTRDRNATRNPVGVLSGIGTSAWRVEADAFLPGTNTITIGFVTDFNSSIPLPDGGALPFQWQSVPVGTLFP
jgi:hypothetical protein